MILEHESSINVGYVGGESGVHEPGSGDEEEEGQPVLSHRQDHNAEVYQTGDVPRKIYLSLERFNRSLERLESSAEGPGGRTHVFQPEHRHYHVAESLQVVRHAAQVLHDDVALAPGPALHGYPRRLEKQIGLTVRVEADLPRTFAESSNGSVAYSSPRWEILRLECSHVPECSPKIRPCY